MYNLAIPQGSPLEGSQINIIPKPAQFTFSDLTPSDSHMWRCIAIIDHNLRAKDKEDVHTKVKIAWSNGEDTWVHLDALCIQDPLPLVTYAAKH